jgi:hypothetical protein
MSDDGNKKKKSDEEFENILDILDPHIKEKFESELAHVFEEMEKDDDLGSAVEKLIDECHEMEEIQSKLILLIKEHLKKKRKNSVEGVKGADADEEKIARDAEELCRKLLQQIDQELDPSLGRISHKDRAHMLNLESKKFLKRVMKNFAVYQVYKVMNPKRIAGETAKDNYVHNLIEGGVSLASKHEGGRPSDLKKYGAAEVGRLKRQASDFKKGGSGMDQGGGMSR